MVGLTNLTGIGCLFHFLCNKKSLLVSKAARPGFCPPGGLPCEQPHEDSKSSSAGVSKSGRSICLFILCILVWDFLEELTLLLNWLESTEIPIYQAQRFSVNIIYENVRCLTFSFLATQFIKPKSKRRVCQICWFTHCIVKKEGRKAMSADLRALCSTWPSTLD